MPRPAPNPAADQDRQSALRAFVASHCPGASLSALPAEASSRRFHRVTGAPVPLMAMDAPPATEANERFVTLACLFRAHGLAVPEVLAVDLTQGFLLVSDLGSRTLGDLDDQQAAPLVLGAIAALDRLHAVPPTQLAAAYSAARLRMETDLFRDWLLERWLGLTLPAAAEACLQRTREQLVGTLAALPQAPLHRDWHSRNLLPGDRPDNPGIVDFQDALVGPVTYDAVSLLRDCYRCWPAALQAAGLDQLHQQLRAAGHWPGSRDALARVLDLTGLQRHLKAAGIFARLALRDGRPSHLPDLRLTFEHLLAASARHAELGDLHHWLARWQPAVLARLPGASA